LESACQKALSKTGYLLGEVFTEVEVFNGAPGDRRGPEVPDLVAGSYLAHLTDYMADAGDGKNRSEADI
jgi:hypothetical protein